MQKIGIIVNTNKDADMSITSSIVNLVESKGRTPLLTYKVSEKLSKAQYGCADDVLYRDSDAVIVLGGDGTILGVARNAAKYETPILGINLGHLGFLAEVEVGGMYKSLEYLFEGPVDVENRLMLEAKVSGGCDEKCYYALNDVVIARGTLSRILTLDEYINDKYVTSLKGDGLIISTPTGSTAYSLSAGGPIISPDLSVMTLTPICPHSLSNRPSMVVSDNEIIKINLSENEDDAYLTVDGQEGRKIENGEYVCIKKAPYKAKLIKLGENNFYEVLRAKLIEKQVCRAENY